MAQREGERHNTKCQTQPNPNTGQHSTHRLRHSTRPQGERQGGRQHTDGDADIRRGVNNTAALHSPCHPPSTTAPPSTNVRGEHVEDTPPHEERGETLTHTTAPDPIGNSARHDSSTRQHCSGMSRARVAPLHWTGRQQHTPPPFHTPRKRDTIHSSTHPLSLTRVHTTNEQQ